MKYITNKSLLKGSEFQALLVYIKKKIRNNAAVFSILNIFLYFAQVFSCGVFIERNFLLLYSINKKYISTHDKHKQLNNIEIKWLTNCTSVVWHPALRQWWRLCLSERLSRGTKTTHKQTKERLARKKTSLLWRRHWLHRPLQWLCEKAFLSHAEDRGSIPGRDRSVKQIVTAPLPNARQQVSQ